MADNTDIKNAAGGTETIADDEITGGVADGAKVQRLKVGFGADGTYVDVESGVPLPVQARAYYVSGTATSASDDGTPIAGPIDASAYAEGVLRINASSDFAASGSTGIWVGSRADADPADEYQYVRLVASTNPTDPVDIETVASVTGSGFQEYTFPIRSRYIGLFVTGASGITAGSIEADLILRPVAHPPAVQHVSIDAPIVIGSISGTVPISPYSASSSGDMGAVSDAVALNDANVAAAHIEITGTWVGTITFSGWVRNIATGQWVTSTTANGKFAAVKESPSGDPVGVTMTAYTSGLASALLLGWSGQSAVDLVTPFIGGAPVAAGNPVPTVRAGSATPTTTSVTAAAADTTLLAANSSRRWFSVYNEPTAALLYLKLGTGASTTSYTAQVQPGGFFDLDSYTGVVNGYWATATGTARCTEVAA